MSVTHTAVDKTTEGFINDTKGAAGAGRASKMEGYKN